MKSALHTAGSGSLSWPTANAQVSQDGENPETWLVRRAAMKAKGYNSNGCGTPLAMAAVMWRTPDSYPRGGPQDVEKRKAGGHSVNLQDQTATWATPTTRDWKDGASPSEKAPTNGLLGRQAPRSGIGGQESRRRLNPLFVEWLMGFPIGWTDSKPLATESYQTWLRSRGGR